MKLLLLLFLFVPAFAELPKVTEKIEEINQLREQLVAGVQGEVTTQTFKAVCKPVGQRAKAEGKKQGWEIRQVSYKYRNAKNKPNRYEKAALQEFQAKPQLISFFENHSDGLRYYRRITVQKACLNCHGPKESRPQFIKDKYKNDLAFNFKEGDLRGIYSVYVPKEKRRTK